MRGGEIKDNLGTGKSPVPHLCGNLPSLLLPFPPPLPPRSHDTDGGALGRSYWSLFWMRIDVDTGAPLEMRRLG